MLTKETTEVVQTLWWKMQPEGHPIIGAPSDLLCWVGQLVSAFDEDQYNFGSGLERPG
jgi:hypothetical protein